jgi:SagB-type dehydrogenase family enzyme
MSKISKRILIVTFVLIGLVVGIYTVLSTSEEKEEAAPSKKLATPSSATKVEVTPTLNSNVVKLPAAKRDSKTSIEEAILGRRSAREYSDERLAIAELSQLLWAAQGITDPRGFRTAPSAGALYPLELYVASGNVSGLADGVYKFKPQGHELRRVAKGDKRSELSNAALGQSHVKNAAAVIIFSAVYERTTEKYGERGIRYVHMEVGHAAQNVYLQAVSSNLGVVFVGAFEDKAVKKIVKMSANERPLGLMPVGKKP